MPDMDQAVRITAEPVDNHRCKFVVSQPLHAAGVRRFASAAEARLHCGDMGS